METKYFVVDSSVVTKWFILEDGSDLALRVRDAFATRRVLLTAPTLPFYEVMDALGSAASSTRTA